MSIAERLTAMGIALPAPPQPAGAYMRAKRTGNLIFVAGQLPMVSGAIRYTGRVGSDISLEEGYDAARICALNALSILAAEAGSLEAIAQLVRVEGFVCSADGFTDQPKVINGASDLFSHVLGEAGSHARLAIGVKELPLGASVELSVIAEVRE
ncbi:MAG: RidA family protein [bacterium]|jgi:enamine deaminase RidA (YjgF/YER057c/UK114 family)|nr:RidA family protein [bacterium]